MSSSPHDHKETFIHHVALIKRGAQGKYCCEILGHQFMFSDQLQTVIRSLYGNDIAELAEFRVDSKSVNRHTSLDEHQGKLVQVYYADQYHNPNRIGSFFIPVLEHH